MKEIQITTTITVKADGEVLAETKQAAGAPDNESSAAAGDTVYSATEEVTEEQAERYAVASDLAEVCDYLTESEVIKIRLIISKAMERAQREGKA